MLGFHRSYFAFRIRYAYMCMPSAMVGMQGKIIKNKTAYNINTDTGDIH